MIEWLDWFRGGTYYTYHTLKHCMDGDLLTLSIVVFLCIGVFSGYLVIAYRWHNAAKKVPDSAAKKGLQDLKWIFILCAVCSYLWVILEVFWPGWRLYMIVLAALNVYTWRYVLRENSMEKLYRYLQDRDELVKKIEMQEEELAVMNRTKL